MCSHAKKCYECGLAQYICDQVLDKFDIGYELEEEFKKNHYHGTDGFWCGICGNEDCEHSVCPECDGDYCYKCAVVHKCHLCNTKGCGSCVYKCEQSPECDFFICERCVETKLNDYEDPQCDHLF